MRFFPEDLRNEARAIASGGKGAMSTWAELKQWASKRGPLAMKSAMMEFLGTYGGTPEAAYVMPELMRNATTMFSPSERGELVRLSMRKNAVPDIRAPAKTASVKTMLPGPSERSSLSLSFKPVSREGMAPRLGVIEPVSPSRDHAYLRDMPIRMRERLNLESAMPAPQARMKAASHNDSSEPVRQFDFDPHRSPDSRTIGAQKGEHIVRSLIHSVRSHGRDESSYLASTQAQKAEKAAKQAAPKRKARAVKARKKTHSRAKGGRAKSLMARKAAKPRKIAARKKHASARARRKK